MKIGHKFRHQNRRQSITCSHRPKHMRKQNFPKRNTRSVFMARYQRSFNGHCLLINFIDHEIAQQQLLHEISKMQNLHTKKNYHPEHKRGLTEYQERAQLKHCSTELGQLSLGDATTFSQAPKFLFTNRDEVDLGTLRKLLP